MHISAVQVQQEVPPTQSRGDRQGQEEREAVHPWDAASRWILVWQLGSVLHLCCLVRVSHLDSFWEWLVLTCPGNLLPVAWQAVFLSLDSLHADELHQKVIV